jgi:hypothetical protein
MKSKSKIKVLKNNQNDDSYTFITNLDSSPNDNLKVHQPNMESEVNTKEKDMDNLNKIYQKKKVLTNEDLRRASKGLKFNNPSKRNHSAIYE